MNILSKIIYLEFITRPIGVICSRVICLVASVCSQELKLAVLDI